MKVRTAQKNAHNYTINLDQVVYFKRWDKDPLTVDVMFTTKELITFKFEKEESVIYFMGADLDVAKVYDTYKQELKEKADEVHND